MKREEDEAVITLSDLWHIFLNHWIPILLAALLCFGLAMVYGLFILKPKYSSTATLYILKQDGSNEYVITQSDFSLALNIVSDCSYMVTSREVLNPVIEEQGLDMSYSSLSSAISIRNPDKTRILEVTVSTHDPELSKQIVDAVCEKASVKINESMKLDQVNIYSKGSVNHQPSNSIEMTTCALIGAGAAVAVYFIYLVAFLLDDSLRTEEDIEKYLGLTVIGVIPNSHGSKKRYGRYSKYGKYGKYGYYSYGYRSNSDKNNKDTKTTAGSEKTEEVKKS